MRLNGKSYKTIGQMDHGALSVPDIKQERQINTFLKKIHDNPLFLHQVAQTAFMMYVQCFIINTNTTSSSQAKLNDYITY